MQGISNTPRESTSWTTESPAAEPRPAGRQDTSHQERSGGKVHAMRAQYVTTVASGSNAPVMSTSLRKWKTRKQSAHPEKLASPIKSFASSVLKLHFIVMTTAAAPQRARLCSQAQSVQAMAAPQRGEERTKHETIRSPSDLATAL